MTTLHDLLSDIDRRPGPFLTPEEWRRVSAALRAAMSLLSEARMKDEALCYSVYFEYLKALGEETP